MLLGEPRPLAPDPVVVRPGGTRGLSSLALLRARKSAILDSVSAVPRYNRDDVRRALIPAAVETASCAWTPCNPEVVGALENCWAVLNTPARKLLVPLPRRHAKPGADQGPLADQAGIAAKVANPNAHLG